MQPPDRRGPHMHELSLVEELVKTCTDLAQGRTVAAVSARCSSAVDPVELREAFTLLVGQVAVRTGGGGALSKADLKLETVPVRFRCTCGFDGELGPEHLVGHIGICPSCGRVGEVEAGIELVAMSFAEIKPFGVP
jgi:Zn finger protein HypA/HybF involved in hydrogenase expression